MVYRCQRRRATKLSTSITSEKAHARTICLCSNECSSFPVSASHILLQRVSYVVKNVNHTQEQVHKNF
jgi:hydroxymethylglutaryl-CoA reductase